MKRKYRIIINELPGIEEFEEHKEFHFAMENDFNQSDFKDNVSQISPSPLTSALHVGDEITP